MKIEDIDILAYIKRELSTDDLSEYDALMLSSNEFRRKVKQFKTICDLSESLNRQKKIDTKKAWDKLSQRIAFVSLQKKMWNFTRTAAAVLLPLFLLHQFFVRPILETTSSDEVIILSSAPGIVTKVMLPDGSEVWLNAQSELTYPVKFTGKERTVKLSGEAYFKVIANPKNRFNVEIPGDITVSAFGTEFNVNAYHDEPDYYVTLARGKIEVGTVGTAKKELTPGQKAILTFQTGEIGIVQADTYVETAWKDGKMVFRREKLETITQRLSRKFGVIIHLEGDELKDYEYTATFTDETLEDILELLKRSAPITYSIVKQEQLNNDAFTPRVVTIRSK